jgi:DNA repair protein RadC
VLRRGIELNAVAVVLAHNHPSGSPEPSQADIHLTKQLTELLRQIDIRVLDHIVVGTGSCVSFASRGLL